MMDNAEQPASAASSARPAEGVGPTPWRPAPMMRAPERSRTIFLVTFCAAIAPLTAGMVYFGYRSAVVTLLCIGSCTGMEWACFRVTRIPALWGRSHALLTGALLALTLPPHVSWYVPVVAAAFAIIVGKAVFGGVGHFLWQPALVGRLAVSVMFGAAIHPAAWPVLSRANMITGDIRSCTQPVAYRSWFDAPEPPRQTDGFELPRPVARLRGLCDRSSPRYASLTEALVDLPEIRDLLYGATPGGIGETSAVILVLTGLYLIYRHYANWILPVSFIASAALVVAVAPVFLARPDDTARTVWFPFVAEGLDVGFAYVSYHLLAGELLLAALLLSSEMTSRPVTPVGQVLFGLGCGVIGMVLRLYVIFPLSCYVAVLAMNTFTPLLERTTRPRVLGRRRRLRRPPARRPAS